MAAKPVNNPIDYNCKLNFTSDKPLDDVGQFQRLVGKVIYLTITRPYITYSVSCVSQFMHAPRIGYMNVVDRILRNLKSSSGRGIQMKKNNHTNIIRYSDADWAGYPNDRRLTT